MMELFTDLIIKDRMWFTNVETNTKQPPPPPPPKQKKGKKGAAAKADQPEAPVVLPPPVVTINVSGMAVDNQTIADFMTLLEGATLSSDDGKSRDVVFSSVKLNKLQQEHLRDNIFLKKFDITLVKNPPKIPVKKNKRIQTNG